MEKRKTIFLINGSASRNSANQAILNAFVGLVSDQVEFQLCDDLKTIPHFDPERSVSFPPPEIIKLRSDLDNADGIVICTPEYVFSIPSGLKNVIEWCVSVTVLENKPIGIITASANGLKGHEELQLLIKTLMGSFTAETTLLIQGVKGKVNSVGAITDEQTKMELLKFSANFLDHMNNSKLEPQKEIK